MAVKLGKTRMSLTSGKQQDTPANRIDKFEGRVGTLETSMNKLVELANGLVQQRNTNNQNGAASPVKQSPA